jgi:hypothetical protein
MKSYKPVLTATENGKGVMDVDSVKGCTDGMSAYPGRGCYDECYAKKVATQYGMSFDAGVSRLMPANMKPIIATVTNHHATWYRIGTSGDPSADWINTLDVCSALLCTGKTPVIITKHWQALSDIQLGQFAELGAVFNTSTSGMDTDRETEYRIEQMDRLENCGIKSVCRVVTCNYGDTEWGNICRDKQDMLLSLTPVIDNPLRARKSNPRVISGDIILTKCNEAVGSGKYISLHSKGIFLGHCKQCPDQCGVVPAITTNRSK